MWVWCRLCHWRISLAGPRRPAQRAPRPRTPRTLYSRRFPVIWASRGPVPCPNAPGKGPNVILQDPPPRRISPRRGPGVRAVDPLEGTADAERRAARAAGHLWRRPKRRARAPPHFRPPRPPGRCQRPPRPNGWCRRARRELPRPPGAQEPESYTRPKRVPRPKRRRLWLPGPVARPRLTSASQRVSAVYESMALNRRMSLEATCECQKHAD